MRVPVFSGRIALIHGKGLRQIIVLVLAIFLDLGDVVSRESFQTFILSQAKLGYFFIWLENKSGLVYIRV